MRQQTLNFLSAYHPRYLCPACLAQLMIDNAARVRSLLLPTIAGLEHAIAECLNCAAVTRVVRFKPTTATAPSWFGRR